MKNITWNKVKTTVKGWQVGDYIRQTSIAALGVYSDWGTTQDVALGTSVLFLIPGVPLINSILDILEGHVLIGFSRAINAAILIICIALGLSMTLLILGKEVL